MPILTEQLSDALGVSISGVNWCLEVDPAIIVHVKRALLDYHLVCLRSEPLSPRSFSRLASHFGKPQLQLLRDARDEIVPQVSIFDSTYKRAQDKPDDLKFDRRSGWHTDDSYFDAPAKITLLQGLELPSQGGETRFCNARAAFEDLTPEQQREYGDMQAVHSYDTKRAPARAKKRNAAEQKDTTDVVHPLIRRHDETGKSAIYFNSNRTDRIVGIDREHSDALLDGVHAHMTKECYQYHHRWGVGDILMWDNRSVTHSVNMDFPIGERRIHQRILLEGLVPA
ncbi:MAG: TauD/TfdA family dioxygenase [Gammaproteobacteria bacterium]